MQNGFNEVTRLTELNFNEFEEVSGGSACTFVAGAAGGIRGGLAGVAGTAVAGPLAGALLGGFIGGGAAAAAGNACNAYAIP